MTDEVVKNKLYRSRVDRFIGGVCGGVGRYTGLDSNIVRLLFIVGAFIGGIGIILYLAALIIVPENPDESPEEARQSAIDNNRFWGIALIVIGAMLLLWEFNIFDYFYFNLPWTTMWALVLIGVGGAMLYAQWKRQSEAETSGEVSEETGSGRANRAQMDFHRSKTDRKLAGVCGGLAAHFNVDSSLVRLGWVLFTLGTKGLGLVLYIILAIIIPEESTEQTA